MKNAVWLILFMALAGCTYEGKPLSSYFEDPGSLIIDPHFEEYQKSLDDLESEYLQKKITYAEYTEKKKELDEKYTKEVKERNEAIHETQYNLAQ